MSSHRFMAASGRNGRLRRIAALSVVALFALTILRHAGAQEATGRAEDEAGGSVAAAVARLADDRAAALAELRRLWEDAASPEAGNAAVALVGEMAKGPERGDLADLGDTMLDSGRLQPDQAPKVFAAWLSGLVAAKRWPEDETSLRARAQAIAEAAPAGPLRAQPAMSVGLAEVGFGRFAQAERSFRSVLAEVEALPPSAFLQSAQSNLGVALAQQGKMDAALDAFLASETTREALGEPESWSMLNNLAGLYIVMQRWDPAITYSERAVALSPPASASRSRALNNLGNARFGMDDLAGARAAFEESLATTDELGQRNPSALNNLAFVLLKLGDAREALRRFEQIEAIARSENDATLLGVANKNMGEAWIALGDRRRADVHLQAAREIYAADDNRPKRLELYPVLIDNLAALGRHEEALARMREYKTLSDEVVTVASNERIAQLENAAELKRKEAELALREADLVRLRSAESAERLQRQVLFGGQIGLLLVLALMLLNLRNKSRANRALTRKNAEIEAQRERLQQLNEVVRRQSEEDALTGLGNRRHLQARLARDFPPEAAAVAEPMLALVVDLDHFKRINDQFGHPAGDRVLQHVAGVLRQCQRGGDELIRWGGEEFIWLCPNAGAAQGPALCQRLQQALAASPIDIDGERLRVTASIGFAAIPVWAGRRPDADLTLRLADHAVYEAKHAGRDTWRGYVGREVPQGNAELGKLPVGAMLAAGWLSEARPESRVAD